MESDKLLNIQRDNLVLEVLIVVRLIYNHFRVCVVFKKCFSPHAVLFLIILLKII